MPSPVDSIVPPAVILHLTSRLQQTFKLSLTVNVPISQVLKTKLDTLAVTVLLSCTIGIKLPDKAFVTWGKSEIFIPCIAIIIIIYSSIASIN